MHSVMALEGISIEKCTERVDRLPNLGGGRALLILNIYIWVMMVRMVFGKAFPNVKLGFTMWTRGKILFTVWPGAHPSTTFVSGTGQRGFKLAVFYINLFEAEQHWK